jgi:hypothetical protein
MASLNSSSTPASPGAPLPFAEGRIPSLDSFRAVAILLVVLFRVAKTRNCPLPDTFYWIESPFLCLKKSQPRAQHDAMTPAGPSWTPAVLQPA